MSYDRPTDAEIQTEMEQRGEELAELRAPKCPAGECDGRGAVWTDDCTCGVRQPRKAVPVLYLDMDGTVRKGRDELGRFVNGPEDVEVFPEAVEKMRLWKHGGGRIAAVSNQGGVALGIVPLERVAAAMTETDRQCGGLFDMISVCVHHPGARNPEMARCWCRKPSAGAVVEAAHRLRDRYPAEFYPPSMGLFVGDRSEDRQCARSAGLDFVWAADWRASRG